MTKRDKLRYAPVHYAGIGTGGNGDGTIGGGGNVDVPSGESPNQGSRNGHIPQLLCIHTTASTNLQGSINWIMNPIARASYHGIIAFDGSYYQFVNYDRAAWSNGTSSWNGIGTPPNSWGGHSTEPLIRNNPNVNANYITIAVSFQGIYDGSQATSQQYDTAHNLWNTLKNQYPLVNVITHEIVTPLLNGGECRYIDLNRIKNG